MLTIIFAETDTVLAAIIAETGTDPDGGLLFPGEF